MNLMIKVTTTLGTTREKKYNIDQRKKGIKHTMRGEVLIGLLMWIPVGKGYFMKRQMEIVSAAKEKEKDLHRHLYGEWKKYKKNTVVGNIYKYTM